MGTLDFWKKPLPVIVGLVVGGVSAYSITKVSEPIVAPAAPQLTPQVKEGIQTLRSFSDTFTAVADAVKPSVVSIMVEKRQGGMRKSTKYKHHGGGGQDPFSGPNPFEGTPFDFFFQGPNQQREAPLIKGGGTGIIIKSDGMILTNNHVIEDSETITVFLSDGKEYKATVRGADPKTDLAVLKIEAKSLPIARLGNSDSTKVGEWVIAMGNPYGFDYTVTAGIVSAKGRHVSGGQKYEDFIQTDASINPGNSGGPLLNLNGEVIGINTMIAGIGTGIGFAIPSSMAQNVVDQLIATGKVTRPWMGVGIQSVSDELAASLKLKNKNGALVNQIYEDSPALKAGIERGDVIVSVNGNPVKDGDDLIKNIINKKVGDEVELTVIRNGKEKKISIKTSTMPENPNNPMEESASSTSKSETLGLETQSVTDEMAKDLGLRNKSGVVITSVKDGGPADRSGIREGDVILEMNRQPVRSPSDINNLSKEAQDGTILLLISRQGNTLFVPVRLK